MNNLTGNTNAPAGTTTGAPASGAGNGDFLDKGVDALGKRAGHEQSHSTTEKVSDGIRSGVAKLTGKTIPGDKEFK